MFENLKNHVIADAAAKKEEARFYIENGYCKTWNEKIHSDNGIQRYSTARRWEQYQAGEITREKAVEFASKRREKEIEKDLSKKLEKLERVAAAPDLQAVSIAVHWTRNPYWGYNPTAHISDGRNEYSGHASGCGYDKRTAAIGGALNQSASVLKMLYSVKEKALAEFTPEQIAATRNGYAVESNRDFIHYGAGYGVLPYFEGGVGMSSFEGVFNACGYRLEQHRETKTFDYYLFIKKGEPENEKL